MAAASIGAEKLGSGQRHGLYLGRQDGCKTVREAWAII